MNNKKIVIVAIVSLLIGGLIGSVVSGMGTTKSNTTTRTTKKVRLVADIGGINDKSFNESAYNGMKKYCENMGLSVVSGGDCWYSEGDKIDDQSLKLRLTQAAQEVKDSKGVVMAVGFKFETVIADVAKEFGEVSFIGLDFALFDKQPKNLYSILFNEAESGYLAGIAAAYQTKSDRVSFVGGMPVPPVKNFGIGFNQGVEKVAKELGKKITVEYAYSNSFTEQATCKQLAQDHISKGADVVFAAAGPCGTGSFKATEESTNKSSFIGVDSDQSLTLDGGSKLLTSAVKRLDNASVDVLTKLTFQPEALSLISFYGYSAYANVSYNGKTGEVNTAIADPRISPALAKLKASDMENLKTFNTVGPDEYSANQTYVLG